MDMRIMYTVASVFLGLLLLRLIRSYITKPSSALRLPPGPWQLPLIGSLHHLLLSRFSNLPHRALGELSGTYGPLMMLRLGAVPSLVVSSPEAAREVMKTHDLAFCSRYVGGTIDVFSAGGKDIVFSPYNEHWRELRKLCTLELFSQRRVFSFRSIREEEVANLIRTISGESADGEHPVNLTERIRRMINDVAARTVLGDRCNYRDEYIRELDEALRLLGGFTLMDLFPSSQLVRRFSAAARDATTCQRNIYRIIKCIIQEREALATPERDGEDLLGVLLRLQKEGGLKFALTDEIVGTVLWDIFSAGSETSSAFLVWAMSELVRNPQVMHKIQSEVRETFKGQDKINEGDLLKLSCLQPVIKETLRLHPPGPLLVPRECCDSCQVMGYDVPKGTKVFVNVWAISRDKNVWHDAEKFKPERFENSTIDFKGNDFEFTPFGAGRRICPGLMLGLANIELALASLLYHFDWAQPDGTEVDMGETFGLSVKKKSPLWIKAKPYIP